MRFYMLKRFISVLIPVFILFSGISAAAQTSTAKNTDDTAEGAVRAFYDMLTFKKGEEPNWEKVKGCFIKEAVVVLRAGPGKMNVFSTDGFVQDFKKFFNDYKLVEKGFSETIVNCKTTVTGETAYCLILYEAMIPGTQMHPQQGLDSIQLMKKEGKWKIVAITNEVVRRDVPVPDELKK